MDDTYKLFGSPVGQYGTYSFFKALRITRNGKDQIISIGDFFFVRLWQDSELMAIGELQLLWNDRGAGKNLASLRLYFLPENTPAGRSHHGEDEVVGISERVVIRVEELLSWICDGNGWRWGLRAPWAGDCAPAVQADLTSTPQSFSNASKLDFSDVEKEKALIYPFAPGVIVFSYPRYCRYRAMVRRLNGIAEHWLHDPLVAALGGYAAPTKNTRILYCRETFEYPELEGHEFVCNHMAPRLRGRAVKGRKRRARSASPSSASDSSASYNRASTPQGVKVGLRSSAPSPAPAQTPTPVTVTSSSPTTFLSTKTEEKAFLQRLRHFHKSNNTSIAKVSSLSGSKDLNLQQLYSAVVNNGGYDEVTRNRGWKKILAILGAPNSSSHATLARRHYERLLLPFENYERNSSGKNYVNNSSPNGTSDFDYNSAKLKRKKHLLNSNNSLPIATIDISDSPIREISGLMSQKSLVPRLRTPPPGKRKSHEMKKHSTAVNGENNIESNRKIGSESFEKQMYMGDKGRNKNGSILDLQQNNDNNESDDDVVPENHFDPSNLLGLFIGVPEDNNTADDSAKDYIKVTKAAVDINQEFLDSLARAEREDSMLETSKKISVVPTEKLMSKDQISVQGIAANTLINGGSSLPAIDKSSSVRSRPSSLRSVRVKPDRRQGMSATSPPVTLSVPVPPMSLSQQTNSTVDDDIIEVPYKPKSPEIIDLDLYESPDSPQSAKRKKLDILKRGGLEVTTVRGGWPSLAPAVQQQILNKAHFLQIYGTFAPNQMDGTFPPKVTQGKSIYGSSSPEKTVYGNPKDPFMPPPHLLQGVAPRKMSCMQKNSSVGEVLDLTVKPAVEIMRVSGVDQPQNLSAKKQPCVSNEPRQINPALEITLVAKNKSPRPPQKRNSSGKFVSNKQQYINNPIVPNIPPALVRSQNTTPQKSNSAAANLVIPNFQVSSNTPSIGSISPVSNNPLSTNITPSFLQGAGGTLLQMASSSKSPGLGALPMAPLLDNPLYMSALYVSLTGQVTPGLSDQHKFAHMYNELVSGTLLNRYPGIATSPTVVATPTSKN